MRNLALARSAALVVAGGTLVSLFAAPARADDRSDIQAVYNKVAAAMRAKDINAIMALGTPDFVDVEGGQTLNAKQTRAVLDQQFKMTRSLDALSMHVDKLDVKGKTAVAVASYAMKGTISGPDGKSHALSDKGVMRDTLVKTPRGWLFKRIETVSQHPMMDGKPAAASAPASSGRAKKK